MLELRLLYSTAHSRDGDRAALSRDFGGRDEAEHTVVGAGGGGILAQQQDETAEYSLSQMLGDFMYYVIVYGYT